MNCSAARPSAAIAKVSSPAKAFLGEPATALFHKQYNNIIKNSCSDNLLMASRFFPHGKAI
jgi:hypothetical protein